MARRKGKLTGQQELGQVVGIDSAPSRQGQGGGRPSGLGYDPASGETYGGRSRPYGSGDRGGDSSRAERDVFALVDGKGYRADRFYNKSTDSNGHGEKITVRVPQGIDSQVHAAVREIPEYRSLQDFIRDAIVHRLEYIQKHYELGDGARRFVELQRMEADMERITSEVETMTNAVERVKVSLETAYASRDWGLMKEAMETAEEMLEWMREPYRGRLSELVVDWKLRVKDDLSKWQRDRDRESGE